MKILQVTFCLAPGGAERFVVDLSNELVKEHEVVLMTLIDDRVESETRKFYLFDLDKRVLYKNLGIKKGGGFHFRVLWNVYKAMKCEKADVIHLHIHGIVNFSIIGILLLCWRTTIVQTIHTDFKIGHSTLLYKFLFKTIGRLHKMRWAALSESNYKDMITEYPYLLCRRIDNGRAPMEPTPLFKDVQQEIKGYKNTSETKVYLHVARCVSVKNQLMLVSAFNQFREKGHDAILLIIGDGFDSELGLTIKKIAKDGVLFLDTRKNIADYMLNADCFCLSSLYEGLPITLLEALLSGVPIVSTPVKGALDVVKDGVNGVISEDFTEDAYEKSLERVWMGFDYLKANSLAEKKKCPYSIEVCAKKYMSFYQT